MLTTAKIFKAGNSQALRLPKAFRLDTDEVLLEKNEVTGVITITPKPKLNSLEAFFSLLESAPVSDEFLQPRNNSETTNPFADWEV